VTALPNPPEVWPKLPAGTTFRAEWAGPFGPKSANLFWVLADGKPICEDADDSGYGFIDLSTVTDIRLPGEETGVTLQDLNEQMLTQARLVKQVARVASLLTERPGLADDVRNAMIDLIGTSVAQYRKLEELEAGK
jgi:hypothetical protein